MKPGNSGATILFFSVLLTVSLIAATCTGIFVTGFYAKETMNWQVQSVGQDWVNLFIVVPSLILSAFFSYRKSKIAGLLWAGVVTYIFYTFIIYCFAVHFNRLFPLYCLILGLSFYSLLWFSYSQARHPAIYVMSNNIVSRITGIYFLILSLIFYFLWLSEIIPAMIKGTVPASLHSTGLLTNPVHVLDLSILLPGIFIIGLLVLRRNRAGFPFSVIMLTFFILMDITIGWLAFLMYRRELLSNFSVTAMMTGLAVITLVLLAWNLKSNRKNEAPIDLNPGIIS